MDYVQPSPRSIERGQKHLSPENLTQTQINALNKKLGIKLNKKQLTSILSTIQDPPKNASKSRSPGRESLKLDLDYEEPQQRATYMPRSNGPNYEDDIKIYKAPNVVVAADEDYSEAPTVLKKTLNDNTDSNRLSLVEQKKQKWQREKGKVAV